MSLPLSREQILSLVSGIPRTHRGLRGLLMLQGYFDESADPKHLVMAGYLASVDSWLSFSDEWAELLAMRSPHYPRIDEFHMTSMRSTPERMEMTRNFYRVIERHVEAAFACIIDIKAINDAISLVTPWSHVFEEFRNPYVAAFQQIIANTSGLRGSGALAPNIPGEVDFVFDETSKKSHCIEGWDLCLKHFSPADRAHYGSTPSFRDSKKALPLQAADLLCYWVREWRSNGMSAGEIARLPFPWPKTKQMNFYYSCGSRDEYVRGYHAAILCGQIKNSGSGVLNLLDLLYPAQRGGLYRPKRS